MPEEEMIVAGCVFKRKREFAAGRQHARAALARLGIRGFPLLTGSRREPLWPKGVVGSISHSDSFCAAAVASAERYRGIGIDLEPDEPLSEDLARAVCSPDELARLVDSAAMAPMLAAHLVFCAKESFYKCQFPSTSTFLGFHDVSVRLNRDGTFDIDRFRGRIAKDWVGRVQGRWRRTDGCLVAVAWLVD